MTDRQFVKMTVEERVAVLTIDHAPVNALNAATLADLDAAVDEVIASADVKAVVITGGGQLAFVAGADINEFTAISSAKQAVEASRKGQSVFSKIESQLAAAI